MEKDRPVISHEPKGVPYTPAGTDTDIRVSVQHARTFDEEAVDASIKTNITQG